MPAAGSYSREQSSPLYIVDTAGKAVEVGYSAVGRAVTVESGSATGGAAIVDQPQQGVVSAAGKAAEVECGTAGRAVEVDCGAAVKAARYWFSCRRSSKGLL